MKSSNHRSRRQFRRDDVKTRLQECGQRLADAGHLDAAAAAEVMRQRAERLARVPEQIPDSSEILELVRFRIGSESLAIPARFVSDLSRREQITPIPQTQPHFLGLANLRGQVVTVIDLGRFLGIDQDASDGGHLLVLASDQPDCAILVDAVDQVMVIRQENLVESPAGLGGMAELFAGCSADGTMVFDGDALLSCRELLIDQSEPLIEGDGGGVNWQRE